MAFGDQVAVAVDPINATVDPQGGDYVGPANAVEIATGPTPCVLVIECNSDGKWRTYTNVSPGMNWSGLTISRVAGTALGTTATAVRLRWGSAS